MNNYDKQQFQPFYTTAYEIHNLMSMLLGDTSGKKLLEPCVGEGSLLSSLLGTPAQIDVFDIDPKHIQSIPMQETFKNINVVLADFIDLFVSAETPYPPQIQKDYDAVICNPPYGLKFSIKYRKLIKKKFPNLYARESYGLFLVFGILTLKTTGRYVYIIPDTFMTSHLHNPLRQYLIQQARPSHIIQFKSKRFQTVHFGYGNLCIIAGYKEPLRKHDTVIWVDAIEHHGNLSIDLFKNVKPTPANLFIEQASSGWIHPQKMAKVTSMRSQLTLGEIAECKTGIYSGNNQKFCGFDEAPNTRKGRSRTGHPINWAEQVKTDALTDDEKSNGIADSKIYVPLIKGGHRDVFAHTHWAIRWGEDDVAFYATDTKARLQNASYYFRKGLAIPMVTSNRISASLMDQAIFDQGVVGVFPHDDEMIDFLLIYLNSEFVGKDVKSIISPGANNSANYIKKIPIPLIKESDLEEANHIIAKAKKQGWESTNTLRQDFINRLIS